uniref:Uncharacterized protein n=1 Tax=viral metagenome TaxID=1070528 RepID=A0A6M3J7Q8_9ZZZZ
MKRRKEYPKIECSFCGKVFDMQRKWAKFCGTPCRLKNHYFKKTKGVSNGSKANKKNVTSNVIQKASKLYLRSS